MKCLTLPETGTLWFPGSPRKHQIGPPGTKNPLRKHMIQGIPPNNDVIDPFTFRHFLGKNWMSQGFPKILKCYCPLHFFQTILRIGTSRFWHFRVKPEVPSAQFWNRKFKKNISSHDISTKYRTNMVNLYLFPGYPKPSRKCMAQSICLLISI